MPVRIKITLLFTSLVFIILALVCFSVYYFSYTARIDVIKKRLNNRAITTARLLSRSEIFDRRLIEKIDSFTTISLANKAVKAYDYKNNAIYNYSDIPGDTLTIKKETLDEARIRGDIFFAVSNKEAVAYHYADNNVRIVVIAAAEDRDGRENLKSLLHILLLSFLGGIVIAFTGGYYFSERLLYPIKKIADNVNEISAQNFTRRIRVGKSRDEWFYLSDTINSLLNRLQESFDLQRRFISNASHELSTPLTSISSQLEVALQRARGAEEYQRVMQSIYQDVRQMSKLTQTLLEFAKASGNPGGIEISPVRIDEVLLRLPADVTRTNEQFIIALTFDELPEQEEHLQVYGNEELLFTAIRNIVVNACKYSPDHRAVVRLAVQGNKIFISVQDNGTGISESEKEKIFQPFYRIDESRTTEGFGLGLALAQRIIKLHKGLIEVKSEKGRGTTFTIILPSSQTSSAY